MAITIRHARQLCDLSQREMAEKLGVNRETYRKWEKSAAHMPLQKFKLFLTIVGRDFQEIIF